VWYSFSNEHPLEVSVPVRSVEDTVRKLKRAARYLERTQSTQAKRVEVRVQIGVEPEMEPKLVDGKPVMEGGKPVMVPVHPPKSIVKFLGHEPWLLGRRISKMEADAREAGVQAAEDVIAARPASHRRTTAGTRPVGRHTKASLPDALVWAVITQLRPPFSGSQSGAGVVVFPGFTSRSKS
jgi:hypothetical protein